MLPCNLQDSNVLLYNLQDKNFISCNLQDRGFLSSNLQGSNLLSSIMHDTSLLSRNLSSSNFHNSSFLLWGLQERIGKVRNETWDKDLEPRRGAWVRRTQNNHVPATHTHTTILRLAHCVERNATITFQEETPCEQSLLTRPTANFL